MSQSWGRPLRLSHADIARWRAQLLVTGTCHVWMGAVGSDGYGRIAIRNREDGPRTLIPHQVGARLGYGPIPAGATVLHDCEVRLCCRAAPGHLRVGTQSENMRQAVARGRAVGPHPGRVDVRGKVGASRANQAALRAATDRSPTAMAAVLAAVIAEGDPLRDLHPAVRPTRAPRRHVGVRGAGVPGCSGRGNGAGAPWTGRVVAAVRRVTPNRRPSIGCTGTGTGAAPHPATEPSEPVSRSGPSRVVRDHAESLPIALVAVGAPRVGRIRV